MIVAGRSPADATPVMQTSEEVADIATGSVEESLLQVPREYAAAPFEDPIRAAMQTMTDPQPIADRIRK